MLRANYHGTFAFIRDFITRKRVASDAIAILEFRDVPALISTCTWQLDAHREVPSDRVSGKYFRGKSHQAPHSHTKKVRDLAVRV
jgi:hypothetical protein